MLKYYVHYTAPVLVSYIFIVYISNVLFILQFLLLYRGSSLFDILLSYLYLKHSNTMSINFVKVIKKVYVKTV